MLERARAALPELPAARAERFESELGLSRRHRASCSPSAASSATTSRRPSARTATSSPPALANWVTNELSPRLGDGDPADSKVEPAALARLSAWWSARRSRRAPRKEVLDKLVAEGGDPAAIVEAALAWRWTAATSSTSIVDRALEANARRRRAHTRRQREGDGRDRRPVMRETKGRADGGEVNRLVREKLGV